MSKPPINGQHPTPKHGLGENSLLVKVKYNNTLPDIPFDPKFIVNPLGINRHVDYETTSLEHNSKHELLTTADLGVDIDLILPERYAIPDYIVHDPDDERLINDDQEITLSGTKKSPRDKPHSSLHNKVVPWLKKTEYISTEFNRYGSSSEKTETKVGYNVLKNMREVDFMLDKDSQIRAITKTFEAARKPIDKHPTKPGVEAVNVCPLLPDFENWKHMFAHVKFDSEPAENIEQMSQAILKLGFDQDQNEQFVLYFLPTEITMTDRSLGHLSEGKEYEYKSTRHYAIPQHGQGTYATEDDFFFVFRGDSVFYSKLSMEVVLKRRRVKANRETLIVRNRDLNDEERAQQDNRLQDLRRPNSPTQDDPAGED